MSDLKLGLDLNGRAEPVADISAELLARLPSLRLRPDFPKGSDEAIVEMSSPREMTACRNPFGSEILSARTASELRTDPGPYVGDISAGKGHPFYKAHTYPTKVPHPAIMRFILHYTEPGDLVLDGFAGTGMTGVAAQACGSPDRQTRESIERDLGTPKWGARRAYLQDLSPIASFISGGLNLPVDSDRFEQRSKELLAEFDEEYGWMYSTSTPDGRPAQIDFTVWSEVFTCPHCGGRVVFFDAAWDPAASQIREEYTCTECGGSVSKANLLRRLTQVRTLAGDTIERTEFAPVRIHYHSERGRGEKRPDSDDLAVLRRIALLAVPWFPTDPLPYRHMTHERNNLAAQGISAIHHFWGDRPLGTLAVLWDKISHEPDHRLRSALRFWVEQGFWGLSWMNRYRPDGFSQVSQYQSGVYYIPSIHAEPSPTYNLGRKRKSLVKVWESIPSRFGQVVVSTGSSTQIDLPDCSADYVFVDPPFGQNIYYSDLALLTESWHRVVEANEEEAIVDRNRRAPKSVADYSTLISACFAEFFRVLKPGRWMTVEFSNSSNRVWIAIQEALADAGFVVADTRIFDKEQLSYRQTTARNAVKRDLIISAYRPAEALETKFRLEAGTPGGAWAFVREHLAHLPVTESAAGQARLIRERQADRLWDRMVAYHVARRIRVPIGTTLEFCAGLDERFPRRDGMYFLPDQTERFERFLLTVRGVEQGVMFITNEATAIQWLRDRLSKKALTYADIQPAFFSEVQAGAAPWDEIPDLLILLQDNFVQDEHSGRWRTPDPRQAADLEQLRTRALLREFAKFIGGKGKLVQARAEVIRAGFKDCWEQNRFDAIATVGRRLPDDAFADDPTLLFYFRNAERLAAS